MTQTMMVAMKIIYVSINNPPPIPPKKKLLNPQIFKYATSKSALRIRNSLVVFSKEGSKLVKNDTTTQPCMRTRERRAAQICVITFFRMSRCGIYIFLALLLLQCFDAKHQHEKTPQSLADDDDSMICNCIYVNAFMQICIQILMLLLLLSICNATARPDFFYYPQPFIIPYISKVSVYIEISKIFTLILNPFHTYNDIRSTQYPIPFSF